jgi:hypothetical protein
MMSHYHYSNPMMLPYAAQPQPNDPVMQQHQDMNLLMNAAKTGAIIGATGAAAMNLHQMRTDGMSWQQAASNTVKVGVSAGVATAAATAVGRMFARHPALSLAATLVTGTAVMYALNDRKQEVGDE